jgi:secondary thiamine-phosphate synthase enzyme
MEEIVISTQRKNQLVDITKDVYSIVKKSGVKEGSCLVYVPHATAAIIINENADPNIQDDILKALESVVPEHAGYKHDRIDNNATSHIKAAILGPSETIPICSGEMQLGTWQNIFLAEFDGPRSGRKVIVQIIKIGRKCPTQP